MSAAEYVSYVASASVATEGRQRTAYVGMGWTSADPFVVAAIFLGPDDRYPDVEWVIGRDLLATGLRRPAGLADVRVSPTPDDADEVLVTLSTPDGEADIYFDAADLAEFLAATDDVVPIGEELAYVSIDAAIHRLIADESGWFSTGEAA